MAEHPSPLVPPEVDLRGLPWMRLDTGRLLDSDLFALSTGAEFKAAVSLWCKSWTQQPAASLPMNDRILAHLSGAGTAWKKLKLMALRGWIECDDGRLYHPVVAEQALLAWDERLAYRAEKEAAAERKQKERIERAQIFEALAATGHKPKWNTPTAELRDLLAQVTDLSRVTGGDESQGHPSDVTDLSPAKRGTGRDGTGEGLPKASARSPGADEQTVEVIDGNGSPTTSVIAELTAAQSAVVVKACLALRKMGAIRFHPGDEALAALAVEGFTAEQIVRCAGEKTLRDACLWNDPDVRVDLFDLLINGASQQDMGLTPEQYLAVKSAVTQVSIGYIASTLRGRRRDAANQQTGVGHGNAKPAGHAGAGAKLSAVERVRAANAAAEQREQAASDASLVR